MTPAPSVRHQTISLRLALELVRLLVEPGHGRVWHAPIGVRFPATGEGAQPDLRRLYERQGVEEYWIVDPEADAVEVWRFGEEPTSDRFVDLLPVRLGTERVGEIELARIFEED